MKELRDPEARQIGSDKQIRDQELHHLVTSSIPSPPYSGLSLINTSGLTVLDPIYSAHLFATFAASPRFQLPIPIQLPVQGNGQRIYATTIPVNGLPTANHPNAQLDILSSWVNEQATKEERKISGNKTVSNNNKNNKKRGTNFSVNTLKANKKNKNPIQNGLITSDLISSENHMDMKKDAVDNVSDDMNIRPTIIPIDKTSKVGHKKCENGDGQPGNNNNNNNNNKGSIQHQQSNQQSRDKVFTCPICSRCFGYKHVLQNHERTHTGEKPYFCKICDKRFTRDHHLKTHMRLHTGEKPYNCTHCDRQFVQVANLRRHLRVHTGERPYSCELCSSRFSDSNQLKAHMLIHKGQKPYFCEACAGRFRRRHHLTHHKCMKLKDNKPFPHSPSDITPSPPSSIKRERKSRETRRIIRVSGLPVATVTSGLDSFIPAVPEQTHPEDLSLGTGNGLRSRNFSGSHSSVSASPSPTSGGSHGSLGPYCNSVSSSEPPEFYSDEERSGTADSSNGKNDSDGHPSPSQG